MSVLRTILTEDAGNSIFDPLRIAFVVAFATAIAMTVYSVVWQDKPFDVQAFATGIGALILTTGGGLWASSHQKDSP